MSNIMKAMQEQDDDDFNQRATMSGDRVRRTALGRGTQSAGSSSKENDDPNLDDPEKIKNMLI